MQNPPGIRVYVWRASAKLASVRAELPFRKDRGLQVAKPQCIKLSIFHETRWVRDSFGDQRTTSEHASMIHMDEGPKRVLLIAASILAARNLAHWDGRPSPLLESSV